jgi:hypothetical protein
MRELEAAVHGDGGHRVIIPVLLGVGHDLDKQAGGARWAEVGICFGG